MPGQRGGMKKKKKGQRGGPKRKGSKRGQCLGKVLLSYTKCMPMEL